ncbi:EDD domain protein, DegV family [Nonomuraea jiangxiensis]|uniref:EDD domain protein, DegV family n=1 Tax=Nonomuraea jiangxiensis TaxID=633440 RepID=A0A1G7YEV5_9ACTN|nr:EDD domain protein, DegV family [Nonomuraea jiangxiensis]
MQHRIAVVTDSTACLPAGAGAGVTVVAVQVVGGDVPYLDGPGVPGTDADRPVDGTAPPTGEPPLGGRPVGSATRRSNDPSDRDPLTPGGERSKDDPLTSSGESSACDALASGGERSEVGTLASSDESSAGDALVPSGESGRSGSGAASSSDEDRFTGELAGATTSRPSPARFAACYASLAAAGATGIVSIHLSREMSGTVESARAAAREAPVPVEVIDSRSIAMGLGYPVLAAARAAAEGASLQAVASAARRRAGTTRTFFYVDTLEFLRRSGRIGTAASLVGSALMIKPLLHIVDGRILLLEKVRTASRAIARLEDLAVEAAGERSVAVAVQHLGARERAEALAERLPKRIPGLAEVQVVEVGAVIGIHVGPGMLGLTITSSDF